MIKFNKAETKLATSVIVVIVAMLVLSIIAGFHKPLSLALSHLHFYMFVRICVCGSLAFAAYLASMRRTEGFAFLFGGYSVMFNPLLPLHLSQPIWMVTDVCVIITYWFVYKKLLY